MRVISKITKIVGAWGFLTIFNVLFDDIAYPLAIWKWGPVVGGGFMALLAMLICFVMLISYERMKIDWLGVNVVETIKIEGDRKVKRFDGWFDRHFDKSLIFAMFAPIILVVCFIPTRAFLLVLWALRKNDVFAFIALNIAQDPFVATVFLRHGRFDGLRRKDWFVFIGSLIFSNGYWIIRNTILVAFLKYGWEHIVN